jgi:hypothetical protein
VSFVLASGALNCASVWICPLEILIEVAVDCWVCVESWGRWKLGRLCRLPRLPGDHYVHVQRQDSQEDKHVLMLSAYQMYGTAHCCLVAAA